ncbi:MAG: hypothetical protein AAF220_00660 [Pseudomonadota bacterium]
MPSPARRGPVSDSRRPDDQAEMERASPSRSQARPVRSPDDPFEFSTSGLSPFQTGLHRLMMINELRGGRGAYRLSHAGLGRSGYSFGPPQWDLAQPGAMAKRQIVMEILIHAAESEGVLPLSALTAIDEGLAKRGRSRAVSHYREAIDAALSSEFGRATIAGLYRSFLVEKETMVIHLGDIADHRAQSFLKTVAGGLCVADYVNQFGPPTTLMRFLKGQTVRFNGQTHRLPRAMEFTHWVDYVTGTRFYSATPAGIEDFRRRLTNVSIVARQPRWRELVNTRADVLQAALQNRT